MKRERILVVDDEESLRRVVQVQMEQRGFDVSAAANVKDALGLLERKPFHVILTDLRMPGASGMDLLKEVRSKHPGVAVIILTAFATIETAVEAMQAGAYHYVTKPVNFNELALVIDRALEHYRLVEEVSKLREDLNEKYGFEQIIGRSSPLLAALDIASRAARSSSTVLIGGESGTGKELLARAIHFNSPRKDKPFTAINCGAIPRDLLESELFGYRKGAFTGATENKTGKIEASDGGTLFLDEIGELPMELQVKLLRVIQEGEVQKLGSIEPLKVDVRIVAATNRDLPKMTQQGEFREDLYYRLAVIPVTLPPLRERAEDIPDLVQHFWEKSKQKHGRPELVLPTALLPFFSRYRWPGNVRELENVTERMVVLSRGSEVTLTDLPDFLRQERPILDDLQFELPPHGLSLEELEKQLILKALERFDGNQTKAADYLDLTRKTLIYRMEKHGIKSK